MSMKFFTLAFALLLLVPLVHADDSMRRIRAEPLCDAIGGTTCTTAASVSIADTATGYVYPKDANIFRCGIFSMQANIGSTTDTISAAVNMQTRLNSSFPWGDASATAADFTRTTTGMFGVERLSATIPGTSVRIKIVNNTGTGDAITVNGGWWGGF